MIRTSPWNFTCAFLSLALLSGCSEETKRQEWYLCKVSGQVTLDNQPLDKGTVVFVPDVAENEGGRPGSAMIESDGSYWIGSANTKKTKGLRPGKYKVLILSMKIDPSDGSIARQITPEEYNDLDRTPFEFEVKQGKQTIDLHLTSFPKSEEPIGNLSDTKSTQSR